MNIKIKQLNNKKETPWDLLLLADPSKDMVEKYLNDGVIYLAYLGRKIIGVYVLLKISSETIELKNIAVDKNHQGRGFGKMLLLDSIRRTKEMSYKQILVSTGNSSLNQLALYQKCGFRIIGMERNFFINHYSEEIIENGIKCVDMIKLSLDLEN